MTSTLTETTSTTAARTAPIVAGQATPIPHPSGDRGFLTGWVFLAVGMLLAMGTFAVTAWTGSVASGDIPTTTQSVKH